MSPIPEHLLTGIPRIDREHQALVELIDGIDGVCVIDNAADCHGCILSVRDECAGKLATLLATLKEYMQAHFRYEERLMIDWAVPQDHLAEHQAAHRLIENRFHDLLDEYTYAKNSAATARKVAAELREWLVDHLDNYDGQLAVYVASEDRF
ncbi:MAG TPA: hemerythrin family protein [Rhodocyclaceae bacterium]